MESNEDEINSQNTMTEQLISDGPGQQQIATKRIMSKISDRDGTDLDRNTMATNEENIRQSSDSMIRATDNIFRATQESNYNAKR